MRKSFLIIWLTLQPNELQPPIMNWLCPPQNSHIETPNPKVTVFAARAFREIIQVKWSPKCEALIQ